MGSLIVGEEYSDLFHMWSGAGFYLISLISIILGALMYVKVHRDMNFVERRKAWRACQCKDSVLSHLMWIQYTVIVWGLIVVLITGYSLQNNWMVIDHVLHISFYIIVAAYFMTLKWARNSSRHFKGMAECNGNIHYHAHKLSNGEQE